MQRRWHIDDRHAHYRSSIFFVLKKPSSWKSFKVKKHFFFDFAFQIWILFIFYGYSIDIKFVINSNHFHFIIFFILLNDIRLGNFFAVLFLGLSFAFNYFLANSIEVIEAQFEDILDYLLYLATSNVDPIPLARLKNTKQLSIITNAASHDNFGH